MRNVCAGSTNSALLSLARLGPSSFAYLVVLPVLQGFAAHEKTLGT